MENVKAKRLRKQLQRLRDKRRQQIEQLSKNKKMRQKNLKDQDSTTPPSVSTTSVPVSTASVPVPEAKTVPKIRPKPKLKRPAARPLQLKRRTQSVGGRPRRKGGCGCGRKKR